MPTTSPRDSISVTSEPAMSWSLTAMPILSAPASTVKSSSLPASFSTLTAASKAAVTRLFTSTLPAVVCDGKRIEPLVDAVVEHALRHCRAADGRRRRALAGVADAVAVIDRRIERVRRRDRDALVEHVLDDVVIGADLRRGQDQAVDRRVLDDLVQDLDFARDVVDRRFRAEHDEVRADHVGRDLRARRRPGRRSRCRRCG